MRDLHVVAVSEDGRHVLLATRRDATSGAYRVAVDDRLAAAVRGDAPRPATATPASLTPRDIQARLRGGESVEQIAQSAGVPVERVERYAGPVLAERERVVDGARAASVHRPRLGASTLPLGLAAQRNLEENPAYQAGSARWSARREESGGWVVELSWSARGRRRTSGWRYDLRTRELTPVDTSSAGLGHVGPEQEASTRPARRAPAPAARRPPAVSSRAGAAGVRQEAPAATGKARGTGTGTGTSRRTAADQAAAPAAGPAGGRSRAATASAPSPARRRTQGQASATAAGAPRRAVPPAAAGAAAQGTVGNAARTAPAARASTVAPSAAPTGTAAPRRTVASARTTRAPATPATPAAPAASAATSRRSGSAAPSTSVVSDTPAQDDLTSATASRRAPRSSERPSRTGSAAPPSRRRAGARAPTAPAPAAGTGDVGAGPLPSGPPTLRVVPSTPEPDRVALSGRGHEHPRSTSGTDREARPSERGQRTAAAQGRRAVGAGVADWADVLFGAAPPDVEREDHGPQ